MSTTTRPALDGANTVDLDQRAEEWRSSGWNYAGSDVDDLDGTTTYGTRDTTLGSPRYRSYLSDQR